MSPSSPIAENAWLVVLETLQFAQSHFERLVLARTIPKELGDEVPRRFLAILSPAEPQPKGLPVMEPLSFELESADAMAFADHGLERWQAEFHAAPVFG